MKTAIKWLLIFQLIATLFGFLFFDSVCNQYGPALVRQGEEIGRHNLIQDLTEAQVTIPGEFLSGRDKDALISHGIVSFYQNLVFALPAALFQFAAIVLATGCLISVGSSATSDHSNRTNHRKAEQASDGDA